MTLEEAKEIREKYFKIIGMTGDTDAEIADVIIEPLGKDLLVNFRILYSNLMRGDETVNNDKILQGFKTNDYQVSAVLDYDGDRESFSFDEDIEAYKDLI